MLRTTRPASAAAGVVRQTRAIHTAAPLLAAPKSKPFAKFRPQVYQPPPGLDTLSARYAGQSVNSNAAIFDAQAQTNSLEKTNVELTMKLLQQQVKRAGKSAKNVMVSPVTLARSLAASSGLDGLQLSAPAAKRAKEADYTAIIDGLTKSGDVALHLTSLSQAAEAGASFASSVEAAKQQEEALRVAQLSHLVKLPFPLNASAAEIAAREPIVSYSTNSKAASSPAASSSSAPATPLTHALNFTGYLAPRFVSPDTKFPNFFYGFDGQKTIAHMMVKTGKMWYIEHEKFQMVDIPYLNPNFVATLVLPRVTDDRTIQDHPDESEYDRMKRTPSTVHEVLSILATPTAKGTDAFTHHARYMSQMKGLVALPGFTADYTTSEKEAGGQSDERHRSVLSISPHGLDSGVKTPRSRPGHVTANFTAYFDHPFLFFLRSTHPDHPQILFAGVVNDVFERRDWTSKYPMSQEWQEYKEQIGKQIASLYAKVQ